jgi:hypothetical protein
MEAIMFELRVYYHDVLRYTIIANLDKVQELRNKGFNVQASRLGLGLGFAGRSIRSIPDYGRVEVNGHHNDEFDVPKMADARTGVDHDTLGFY